jgi:pimeloyl-ACP methyl ester carboxylesterase
MPLFMLVHGSFHGPWCWERLAPLLTAAGHRVITPDLASAGERPDLEDYAGLVADAIAASGGRVILVGHSMGALVASRAAELVAEHVAALVHVAGLVIRDGETLTGFLESQATSGIEDQVLKAMELDAEGTVACFPPASAPEIFYNCCTAEDAAWASRRLRPQPTGVYGSPLRISAARQGSVPATYVETLRDRGVMPLYQRQMIDRSPGLRVVTLDTDHSPFLSRPAALARILLEIAAGTE